MTDTLDGIMAGEDPSTGTAEPGGGGASDPDDLRVIPPTGRTCAEKGCDNPLPDGSPPARKYCDEHFRGMGGRAARAKASGTVPGAKAEKAPKLVVQVGKETRGGKGDQRARDTAQGAAAFMSVIATGMSMSGDQVCAGAVAGGAAAWGDSVGELSKYQPWLQSFFAPVGGGSQLGAWLGFLMATGAIALPVLAHHGMLPESVGAKLGGVMVAADDAAQQSPAA
jgi:hypothetical protein